MAKAPKIRLQKELKRLQMEPVPYITLLCFEDDLSEWTLELEGAKDTLYAGEKFVLTIRFGDGYPIEAPEVQFVAPAPVHPHIYTNGHICLSVLYDGWSPVLTVKAICLSILSMLSSCTEKCLPEGNDRYVRTAPKSAKMTSWIFHDDKI